MIDAYDISVVATQLEDGVDESNETEKVSGRIEMSTANVVITRMKSLK